MGVLCHMQVQSDDIVPKSISKIECAPFHALKIYCLYSCYECHKCVMHWNDAVDCWTNCSSSSLFIGMTMLFSIHSSISKTEILFKSKLNDALHIFILNKFIAEWNGFIFIFKFLDRGSFTLNLYTKPSKMPFTFAWTQLTNETVLKIQNKNKFAIFRLSFKKVLWKVDNNENKLQLKKKLLLKCKQQHF